MNVPTANQLIVHRTQAIGEVALPNARGPRERTFGTGYGRSSGYASAPRYVASQSLPSFRCG